MSVSIEYFFADESLRALGILPKSDAEAAIIEFPWDQQIALFTQSDDKAGPEVRFLRHSKNSDGDLEGYASVAKFEDGSWLIVAGSTLPGKVLGIFPTTKKAEIILDNLAWRDVQDFVKRFYEASRSELFAWMKERQ